MTYFPDRLAKIFASSENGRASVIQAPIFFGVQKFGATSLILVRGKESIIREISLHGSIVRPEAVLFIRAILGIFGMTILSSSTVSRIFHAFIFAVSCFGKKY